MADLSYSELEGLWIKAGGSRLVAPLMAAIAIAESGGNPTAENKTDNGGRQTSWGLWQISDGTHNQPVDGILDPLTNAQQAVAKYRTQGLGAWGTYTSGAYRKYYKGNVDPSQLPQGGAQLDDAFTSLIGGFFQELGSLAGLSAPPGGASNPVSGLSDLLGYLGQILHGFEWFFVPSHWVRIMSGAGGVLLLIPGLHALMQSASGNTGDASLVIGILLVTISGVLLFIAFHNLPDQVTDLQSLLGWMTQSVSEGKAAQNPGPAKHADTL